MEISAQAAALLLAGRHQPLAGTLQVLGQPLGLPGLLRGEERHAGLPGQVVQQAPIKGRERFVRAARGQEQLADRLALVGQRQVNQRVGRRRAPGRQRFLRA